MKKIILVIIGILLIMPLIYAEQETLGYFKKGECLTLTQTCANCTYVNFTVYNEKNNNILLEDVEATKQKYIFNYTTCNITNEYGHYIVNGIGDVDGENIIFSYDYYVTSEGSNLNIYIISVIVLLFVYLILIVGIWKEDVWLTAMAAMVITILGIYSHVNGVGDIKNYVTDAFALINIMIGAYISIRVLGEQAVNELGG